MHTFLQKVETLRWDDHRYYHQSRINQTLHFFSAISFLVAYVLLPVAPALAALTGWLVGMVTRQSGHLFFEPRGYDQVNHASDEQKEAIKAGYNMRRKAILIAICAAAPLVLVASPGLFGLLTPGVGFEGYWHNVGLVWLVLGIAGILVRTVQLAFLRGPSWGLAWATKIVTDPFHNIAIYWRSPLALLRGERLDPIHDSETSQPA